MLWIAGAALFLLALYSWFVEPASLEIKEEIVEIDRDRLDKSVHFLFISDLHLGWYSSARQFRRQVRRLKGAQKRYEVQALLIGGDLLDSNPHYLPLLLEYLTELQELRLPVYLVLGNHDYYSYQYQMQPLLDALQQQGVYLLRNQSAILNLAGQKVLLIGLDDLQSTSDYCLVGNWKTKAEYQKRARGLDWYQQFDSIEPDLARIVMTHNPDGVYLPGKITPDLVVAGHTHGGQLAPVDWFSAWLPKKQLPPGSFQTWSGRAQVNNTTLLVSRGIGGSSFPLRFFRKPQALVITMQPDFSFDHLVIGISGKPRSGKDTVASLLKSSFPGIKMVTIGNAVKEEYDQLHGTNTRHQEEDKIKHRNGLNALGSKRREEDRDYWVKKAVNHAPPMLITDVRWSHEADVVHKAKGFLIRVEASKETLQKRMGADFHGHIDDHFESQLDAYQRWDFVIENNGTLEELEDKVEKVSQQIVKRLKGLK